MSSRCQLEIPSIPGAETQELTVGREFFLNCEPERFVTLDNQTVQLELEQQAPWQLKLLHAEWKDPQHLSLKLTSYRVGQHQLPDLKLKIGNEVLSLGPQSIHVQSVMKPEEPVQEPFGPIGPFQLSWPPVVWLILGVMLISLLSISFFKIYRYRQRKKVLEELQKYDSALSPLSELHSQYRKWQRKYGLQTEDGQNEIFQNALLEIEHSFRLYLTRTFRIPALEWSQALVADEVKRKIKKIPLHKDTKLILIEIDKAKKARKLKPAELLQLLEQARKNAESIDSALQKESV